MSLLHYSFWIDAPYESLPKELQNKLTRKLKEGIYGFTTQNGQIEHLFIRTIDKKEFLLTCKKNKAS